MVYKCGLNGCETKWCMLQKVDCFKYLGLQVTVDGGCAKDVVHRMDEGYTAWGALKSEFSNKLYATTFPQPRRDSLSRQIANTIINIHP